MLLPYVLRRTVLSRVLGAAPPTNAGYLRRLSPHYWLGYGILALAFTHASFLMGAALTRTSATGLLAAVAALILLLLQAVLGIILQNGVTGNRGAIRNLHLATMLLLATLVAAHLALN